MKRSIHAIPLISPGLLLTAGNLLAEETAATGGANIHWVDIALIVAFMVFILWFGSWFYRWVGEAEDFTLAGRNLPPFILAATMAATNINLYGIVSQTGTAYRHGISIIWQGWTGAMALALAGLFILPVFRRLKIATVPEFLERRFGRGTRGLVGFFGVFRLAFWLGVVLNTAVRASEMISGPAITASLNAVGHSLGIPASWVVGGSYVFWVAIFSVLVIVYTFLGGMWSVAILDALCFVFIMVGALIILPLTMKAVGWFPGMLASLNEISPQHLELMPASGPYSWSFVLAMMFLGIQWASTDPGLVQKSFSSRDTTSLAKGLVLAGVVTIPYALFTFVPALASRVLYPELAHQDYAFPALMVGLLPMGLMGMVCIGLLASQFSTIDANLTSAATIFTNDIYRNLFNREASSRQVLFVVRAVTLVIGVLMILFSFLIPFFENAVEAYLTVVSFVDMPLFVIAVVMGLLWKRANSRGAAAGYLGGILLGAAVIFPFKYAAAFGLDPQSWPARNYILAGTAASALGALVVCVAVSLLSGAPDREKVRLVWATRSGSDEETAAGLTYSLWPESGWGRFWLWLMFAGLGVFLAGVLMGQSAISAAGWIAVAGMVVFFLGAWSRLSCR
ncbi:MAG: sodium:solute symporter family protein [Candidatus Glassbacteria bacterium]|nr:sodium:solute symporter family protein [Candidatus Glassbacteria bacterium]